MFRPSGAELFLLPASPMAYAMGYRSVAAPRLTTSVLSRGHVDNAEKCAKGRRKTVLTSVKLMPACHIIRRLRQLINDTERFRED